MPTVKDEGVVVRQWEFSETSQTAAIFTREHGLVRTLAKGSRRPNAPYSGGMDVLTRGGLVAIFRPNSELATLTEWDLQEVFWAARRDLRSHYAGLYFADLCSQVVTDHDPHPALYDVLVAALRSLGGADGPSWSAVQFQIAALREAGYRPVLDRDVRTGNPLSAARTYGFDPSGGGLTSDPGPGASAAGDAPIWRVRADTVSALRAGAEGPESVGGVQPASIDRANRLLALYLQFVLGKEPATARFFLESAIGGIRHSDDEVGGRAARLME